MVQNIFFLKKNMFETFYFREKCIILLLIVAAKWQVLCKQPF